MKLIKSSFEIWQQSSGLEEVYKQIEKVGRVCYKSEDKITEDSAKPFVDRMIKSGHGAMLEHGTVYLKTPAQYNYDDLVRFYSRSPYSRVFEHTEPYKSKEWKRAGFYITTNLRVLVENNKLEDLKLLCEPTEHHVKRVTVKFVCDRGVSHEFIRHRVFSFAQESTRYCNYSKDKFGNELTFIEPCWYNTSESDALADEYFINSLEDAEWLYFNLLKNEWKPQQARAVLTNALKTELVMTGFVDDWWGEYLVFDKSTGLLDQRIHGMFWKELDNVDREKYRIVEKGFFPLRCSNAAHPQARELAIPLREEFITNKYF